MSRTLSIWHYLDGLTDNFHSGGSLVIIGDDPQASWKAHLAQRLADSREAKRYHSEWITTVLPQPDFTAILLNDAEDAVHVYPDAGCC
jgi:hypothetical protein